MDGRNVKTNGINLELDFYNNYRSAYAKLFFNVATNIIGEK